MKRVLVIGAHPDDEVLGAGGTIRRHVLAGDDVHVLLVCEGTTVRYAGMREQPDQESQARRAAEILGVKSVTYWGLEDQRLDRMSQIDLNRRIEAHLDVIRPAAVFTHFRGDLNRDHQIVADAVAVATRPSRKWIQEVYAFEIPTTTGLLPGEHFEPDYFVDISDSLDVKLSALACYDTEITTFPHPRSPQALRAHAQAWGSKFQLQAAEPMMTVWRAWRSANESS